MNSQGSSPHLLHYKAEYYFIIATLFTLLQVPNDNNYYNGLHLKRGLTFIDPPKIIPVGPYASVNSSSAHPPLAIVEHFPALSIPGVGH